MVTSRTPIIRVIALSAIIFQMLPKRPVIGKCTPYYKYSP